MKPDHAAEFNSARRFALRACWIRTLTPAPTVRRAGKRNVCMAKSIPAVGEDVDLAFRDGAFYSGAWCWARCARMLRPRSGIQSLRQPVKICPGVQGLPEWSRVARAFETCVAVEGIAPVIARRMRIRQARPRSA